MPARSISERGFSAEMIPTGIESVSQKIAPPKTSAPVRGPSRHDVVHFLAVDEPGPEGLLADELPEEAPVLLPDGLVQMEALGNPLHVLRRRALTCREARRIGRRDVEDHVGHDRHGEKEDDRPENRRIRYWTTGYLAARGSNASRRPSPSRLKESVVSRIARPGQTISHGWVR